MIILVNGRRIKKLNLYETCTICNLAY